MQEKCWKDNRMNLNRLTILIFLIIFSLQSLTKADDIRDFQIEGMSVGDSALDFFTKDKILSGDSFTYKNKKYFGRYIKINSDMYDFIQFHFLKGDNKYIIHAIGGMKDYKNNIDKCYLDIDKIILDISNSINSAKFNRKKTRAHKGDSSGKSKTTSSFFI